MQQRGRYHALAKERTMLLRRESLGRPCLSRVKTGKGQREHMSSAVLPITDIAKILRHVRYAPNRP